MQSGKDGRRAESVSTAAGSVYWQRWGAGPDVLLLHGIPSSSRLWQSTAESLESVATVHMLDLLGYGRSDKPVSADLGIAAQAEVVREWMAVTGWSTGTVVGHDIGGGVAQLLAVNDPDCVSQLVLVDTIAYDSWPEPGIKRLSEPQWDEIMQRIDLAVGLRKGLLRGVVDESVVTDELVQAYAAPFVGPDGGLRICAARAPFARPSFSMWRMPWSGSRCRRTSCGGLRTCSNPCPTANGCRQRSRAPA